VNGGDEWDLIQKPYNPLLQLYKGLDKVTCPSSTNYFVNIIYYFTLKLAENKGTF